MIAHVKADFVVKATETTKCDKINDELEKMEKMKIRCETSRDMGNRGGGLHGGSETCWPRMKEFLPKYIEHLKKLKAENKC